MPDLRSRSSPTLPAVHAGHLVELVRRWNVSQEEVAKTLHVSVRTLKRKLAAEGTSFTELLEEERRERAVRWLASPALSIEQIAEKLGYADASAFTRAFTRWTGKSPGAFRKR